MNDNQQPYDNRPPYNGQPQPPYGAPAQPYYQQPQVVVAQPRTNGLGTAGFVLSTLSIILVIVCIVFLGGLALLSV